MKISGYDSNSISMLFSGIGGKNSGTDILGINYSDYATIKNGSYGKLMKSYYPQTVQRIQERVEEECDLLDYEGSRLYDEYPDKYMLYHLSSRIKESIQPELSSEAVRESFLDELIQVMLYQEISRRRCRRHRCRRYF